MIATVKTNPIPTDICLLASSRLPPMPEKMIIAESGTAPSKGRTMPPIIPAGSPRSNNSSAPSSENKYIMTEPVTDEPASPNTQLPCFPPPQWFRLL